MGAILPAEITNHGSIALYSTLRNEALNNRLHALNSCQCYIAHRLPWTGVNISLHDEHASNIAGNLLGEEIVEGLHGGEFVVFDVEDGVEFGDVQYVLHFFGEVEQFEFAAGVADGSEAAD